MYWWLYWYPWFEFITPIPYVNLAYIMWLTLLPYYYLLYIEMVRTVIDTWRKSIEAFTKSLTGETKQ